MELLAWNIWPTVKCLHHQLWPCMSLDPASTDLFILGALITLSLCQAVNINMTSSPPVYSSIYVLIFDVVRGSETYFVIIFYIATSVRVPQPVWYIYCRLCSLSWVGSSDVFSPAFRSYHVLAQGHMPTMTVWYLLVIPSSNILSTYNSQCFIYYLNWFKENSC